MSDGKERVSLEFTVQEVRWLARAVSLLQVEAMQQTISGAMGLKVESMRSREHVFRSTEMVHGVETWKKSLKYKVKASRFEEIRRAAKSFELLGDGK